MAIRVEVDVADDDDDDDVDDDPLIPRLEEGPFFRSAIMPSSASRAPGCIDACISTSPSSMIRTPCTGSPSRNRTAPRVNCTCVNACANSDLRACGTPRNSSCSKNLDQYCVFTFILLLDPENTEFIFDKVEGLSNPGEPGRGEQERDGAVSEPGRGGKPSPPYGLSASLMGYQIIK